MGEIRTSKIFRKRHYHFCKTDNDIPDKSTINDLFNVYKRKSTQKTKKRFPFFRFFRILKPSIYLLSKNSGVKNAFGTTRRY